MPREYDTIVWRDRPGSRRRGIPVVPDRVTPKRHKRWPIVPVVSLGLCIGILLGLALVVFTDPTAAEPGPPLPAIQTFLAAHQADRDARVPAGGFRSCGQAKAAGFKEIYAGEKAYRPALDRDLDGRACEWNGWRLF